MESLFLFIQIVVLRFGFSFFQQSGKPTRHKAKDETTQPAHEQNIYELQQIDLKAVVMCKQGKQRFVSRKPVYCKPAAEKPAEFVGVIAGRRYFHRHGEE